MNRAARKINTYKHCKKHKIYALKKNVKEVEKNEFIVLRSLTLKYNVGF